MSNNVALIAGATGSIGSAIAKELCSQKEWNVYAISRNSPRSPIADVYYIQVNLNNEQHSIKQLAPLNDITTPTTVVVQRMQSKYWNTSKITYVCEEIYSTQPRHQQTPSTCIWFRAVNIMTCISAHFRRQFVKTKLAP